MFSPLSVHRLGVLALCLSSSLLASAGAEDLSGVPANLGGGLRELAAWHAAHALAVAPEDRREAVKAHVNQTNAHAQTDAAGRVVADVHLDGAAAAAAVRAALEALGATVLATEPAGRSSAARLGLMSVYLPVGEAAAAAKLPGVQSITLVHRPWHHVGAVTSQGVAVTKANLVQRAHETGLGITVGVISDSYNLKRRASLDVVRDDLPGTGNRAHHTQPVVVLQEGDTSDPTNNDEGRAMMQIVHDMAPGAGLAFSTTGPSQASFADAIRSLRTSDAARCDIIVDDVSFPDEPFFSVGVIEQAVEDVVNSTTLAGKKVIYYSAAGNQGDTGYEADFAPVSDAVARAASRGPQDPDLSQVSSDLTAGGFHNFTPGGEMQISQKITIRGDRLEIDFQWNDLFDATKITSDYNLLVFDVDGNYVEALSGIDSNFSTGQAVEVIELDPESDGTLKTYQLVISKTSEGTGEALHFRYITVTEGILDGPYLQQAVPTIIGHAGARSGDGVGAYQFNRLTEPELFSSFGPVSIYFDDQGNRLSMPEVRQQPTISGPDGVRTTVINPFFGTSAAAPHVAGVAALLLEAAGGPGRLTAAQMRTALQSSAFAHDLEPAKATATLIAKDGQGEVTLIGHGDDSDSSTFAPAFFTIQFTGPAGSTLHALSIDLSPAGLDFDQRDTVGFPFTVGSTSGGVTGRIMPRLLPGVRRTAASRLLLTFENFPAGGTVQFGIDRDFARTRRDGNSADYLAHGIVTAVIDPPAPAKPVSAVNFFVNLRGQSYTPADGCGLVNAQAALTAVKALSP